MQLQTRRTEEFSTAELAEIRALVDASFATADDPGFEDTDWAHALGGVHAVLLHEGRFIAHASVVPRTLHIGTPGHAVAWRAGFVEAVCSDPAFAGQGLGTQVMTALGDVVRAEYDLGGLSTASAHFYQRLGWSVWLGPTYVVRPQGWDRSRGDDGGVLVLRHGPSADVDLSSAIACEERDGEDW
jgi:aminoglycoside 2'-N-acetyltransferase I